MFRSFWRPLAVQLSLIFIFAWASGYGLPSFEDADWRTVLFLAPSGIVGNYLSVDPVMRSFYGDVPPGRLGENARPEVMLLVFALLSFNGILILRRFRRERA